MKSSPLRMSLLCAMMLPLTFFIVGPVKAQLPPQVEGTIAQIVKARDYTAQFVVLAKQAFPAGSDNYNKAFKLYASAYSDYGAWDAYVAASLKAGTSKHLDRDQHYSELASQASQSGLAFTNFVDANTSGNSHAIVTVLSSLADLGIKLWTQVSAKISSDRTNAATYFTQATQWQTWAEITNGAPPAPATASPTKNPSSTDDSTAAKPGKNPPKADTSTSPH